MNLQESIRRILREDTNISDIIKTTAKEYDCSTWEINNGYCESFALDVLEKLGGYSDNLFELSGDMFFNQRDPEFAKENWGDVIETNYGVWSKKMLYNWGYPPNVNLNLVDDEINHVWLFYNGKHYDAEVPEGVDNWFEIPLIKRLFNRYNKNIVQESIRRILRENMNVKFYLLRRYDYDELNNILQNSLQTQSRNLKHYKDKTFNFFNNAVVRSMTERIGEELTDGWVEDLPIPENEIYDFVESLFKDKIIKKYDDLVTNNMNLQESIRRILREEIDGSIYKLYKSLGGIGNRELTESLPLKIIRRLPFTDNLLDMMKKASLRYYKDAASLDELVKFASYNVTHSILPWHDERGNDYDNDEYNKWSDFVSNNLEENYGDQIKEYVNKVLPKNSFDNDGYKYVFWKHSEIHGGTGFSEAYKTWGDLIVNKGWWFPLDWWEIKSDLDKMNEGTKIFLKPGDKHNNYGYYFSIKKIKT